MIKRQIEEWYEAAMDRVSGCYKRNAQFWLWIFALILTVSLNVDTLQIAKQMWQEPALRQALVATARNFNQSEASTSPEESFRKLKKEINALPLPIGWPAPWCFPNEQNKLISFFQSLFGWFLTALAISLGAPFWFETLNKLLNLRGTGPKPMKVSVPPSTRPVKVEPSVRGLPQRIPGAMNEFESTHLSTDDLRDIQGKLGVRVSGIFDEETRNGIKNLQSNLGRKPRGILTPFLVERILGL